jgi:hypothetical protein
LATTTALTASIHFSSGKSYDGDLGDGLAVEEDVLHLASRDLDAAGADDVFDAIHYVEVALVVEVAEVP